MENCLFCKIIKGEIPCFKIYESEHVLAFLDISKNPEGHTLVIPKVHSCNMLDTLMVDFSRVLEATQQISNHYVNIGFADGVNIYINSGKEAGQEIDHLHVHIIPRRVNDGIVFSHTKKESDTDLAELATVLKIN